MAEKRLLACVIQFASSKAPMANFCSSFTASVKGHIPGASVWLRCIKIQDLQRRPVIDRLPIFIFNEIHHLQIVISADRAVFLFIGADWPRLSFKFIIFVCFHPFFKSLLTGSLYEGVSNVYF